MPFKVRPRPARRRLILPYLILLLTVTSTLAATAATQRALTDRERTRFLAEADKVDSAIQTRMAAYEQVLLGARGFLDADPGITRSQWRTYVEALNLSRSYPGIQGVGWSVVIPPQDLAQHVASVRAEGFPDYDVWPSGPRDVYTSIIYLEPFRDRNLRAFGFDMFSEPVRHEAMARARDTGAAALTGRVRLVQETDEDVQPGFLMYVPVFRNAVIPESAEERREQLVGFVYAPFRARDLMTGVLGPGTTDIQFSLYDTQAATSQNALYSTVPHQSFHSSLERTLVIAGRTWAIQYDRPGARLETFWIPMGVVVGGIAISGLLFLLTLSLINRRENAIGLAQRMTMELRRSERALQQSNAELEQFAYVASHDLREPLRGVTGYLGLLQHHTNGSLDATGQKFLENALHSTRRMHRLVDGLLEYSRINGRREAPAQVSLNALWDEAVHSLNPQIEETGSRITRGELPTVWGHSDMLLRLLQNLLSNAIKYRGPAGAVVHCSATEDEDVHTVSVRDEGIGIHPDYQGQLFVLFRRLHAQHEIEGTGVGLALCKRIVELHGGRIWVESQEGKGAVFHFTLPKRTPIRGSALAEVTT